MKVQDASEIPFLQSEVSVFFYGVKQKDCILGVLNGGSQIRELGFPSFQSLSQVFEFCSYNFGFVRVRLNVYPALLQDGRELFMF
jgi:hypothetical protein